MRASCRVNRGNGLFLLGCCLLLTLPTLGVEAATDGQTNVGIYFSEPPRVPETETEDIPEGSTPEIIQTHPDQPTKDQGTTQPKPSGKLPQTGEKRTVVWSLAGIGVLGLFLVFLRSRSKRKE